VNIPRKTRWECYSQLGEHHYWPRKVLQDSISFLIQAVAGVPEDNGAREDQRDGDCERGPGVLEERPDAGDGDGQSVEHRHERGGEGHEPAGVGGERPSSREEELVNVDPEREEEEREHEHEVQRVAEARRVVERLRDSHGGVPEVCEHVVHGGVPEEEEAEEPHGRVDGGAEHQGDAHGRLHVRRLAQLRADRVHCMSSCKRPGVRTCQVVGAEALNKNGCDRGEEMGTVEVECEGDDDHGDGGEELERGGEAGEVREHPRHRGGAGEESVHRDPQADEHEHHRQQDGDGRRVPKRVCAFKQSS
jgi:hypothetical protein